MPVYRRLWTQMVRDEVVQPYTSMSEDGVVRDFATQVAPAPGVGSGKVGRGGARRSLPAGNLPGRENGVFGASQSCNEIYYFPERVFLRASVSAVDFSVHWNNLLCA